MQNKSFTAQQARYWDDLSDEYCLATVISTNDFHYGPLLPGDAELCLLPKLNGIKCLEIGCGAAQNSVFLASQGGCCTAIDISAELLKAAGKLADTNKVTIELHRMPMEEIANLGSRQFDLIHSSYALPFAADPGDVITQAAKLLSPGGQLIFSTIHPLFAGEWLELDGIDGLFLENYFNPPIDCRFDDAGNEIARSNAYPIGKMCDWIMNAGLSIERILEPYPSNNPPYYSKAWNELRPQMENIPASIIFSARKSYTQVHSFS
ncbi:MAG: methyltransferase domain-containing protein [Victivallaceae bacterium]|nr:methyltransferase domain-containing protein [Victivallaceae bacterium]